jgi:hypothetical protein
VDSESDVTDSGLFADLSPSPKLPDFPRHDLPGPVELPERSLELLKPIKQSCFLPGPVELPERSLELPKPIKQSCFRYKGGGDGNGGGDGEGENGEKVRKVARFKVSFVDDPAATVAPTSD